MAERLFGRLDPIGRQVRIGGRSRFGSIGIYEKPSNIFEPPGQETGGIIPFEPARESFQYDETNASSSPSAAAGGAGGPGDGRGDRRPARSRNLHPGMPNTFDLITQDQILDVVGNLTSYFFLAMVALSSVALLVGGIGVMAIMMVSVTDRTREIGLRMALGATRREILWQFLVEAGTLTLLGGGIGIVVGLGAGALLKAGLGLEATAPLWSVAVACAVSVGDRARLRADSRQPGRPPGPGGGAPAGVACASPPGWPHLPASPRRYHARSAARGHTGAGRPLTSCDHSPSPGRSAVGSLQAGTRSTPLQPRDEAGPCLRVPRPRRPTMPRCSRAPRSPRSGATPRPTPPAGSSSAPGRPASRSIRWSRRWICSG